MELRKINISGLEYYQISPDGQVFNTKTGNWIKPFRTPIMYYVYGLTSVITRKRKNYFAHRLVAFTYLDPPTNPNFEVDHIDEDKGNNHYSNLQWISHSDNVMKSFRLNKRNSWWLGKNRPSPGIETRKKMSNAKLKPIQMWYKGEKGKSFKSVQDAANFINRSRVTMFMILKQYNGVWRDYTFKYKT
jgi:hypothetical protein